jgi:hypothetical protein
MQARRTRVVAPSGGVPDERQQKRNRRAHPVEPASDRQRFRSTDPCGAKASSCLTILSAVAL